VNIGIFGCSSGGQLAAMATAWFQMLGLPPPGALGIYSAGTTPNRPEDGSYSAAPIGEDMPPPLDFGRYIVCLSILQMFLQISFPTPG